MTQAVVAAPPAAGVALRPLLDADLEIYFQNQLDPQANWMAGFTAENPADRAAFDAHWAKVRAHPGVSLRTILYDGQVAGSILCHDWFGEAEVSYWLGGSFWGRGIAKLGLELFLKQEPRRPLAGRVVEDNQASRRVLEKCGFQLAGQERGYANARRAEVTELIFTLPDG
jgi:RimJ/RimL family protein N-acetyltransferase